MKAAIYCRVSTKNQKYEGTSLETQLVACQKLAKERGYHVEERHIIQEVYSGLTMDRPYLTKLKDWIDNGEIEAVVIHAGDRFMRDGYDLITLKRYCDKASVELLCVTEDLSNELVTYILGWASKQEAEHIKERTGRGKQQRLRNGLFMGGCGSQLYGYDYIKDTADKKNGYRQVNPETSQTVKRIYKLFLEGEAINNIVVRLSTLGIKSPKGQDSWNRVALTKILTNRAYTGKATFWGIELCQPQLISLQDFEKAQLKLQRNREIGRHSTNSSYLFSGYIFCHECGKRYIGSASHHIRYYCCPAGSKNVRVNPCQGKSLRADKIETELWLTLESFLSNPENISKIGLEDIKDDDYEPELIALKARLKFYQNERKSLWHLYCETKDLATFKELMKPLDEQTEQANKRYAEIQELIKASGQRPDPSDIKEACQRIYESMGQLAYEDRRRVLEALKVRFDPVTRRLEINLPCRVRREPVRLGETLLRGG